MRIANRIILLVFLLAALLAASSCRPLIKEVFKRPKVRVTEVFLVSDPVSDPKGPWEFMLTLEIDNPNGFQATVTNVAYTAIVARQIVSEGDHRDEVRIDAAKTTEVRVPLAIRPDAFREALRQVLQARRVDYEFNGSVAILAPVIGTVRIPFSRNGNIDPVDLLIRKKSIKFN
jgi:LEA14-like dessication related protein